MSKMPNLDIFSLDDSNSHIRSKLRENPIIFSNSNLKRIRIPSHYKKQELSLPTNNYGNEIRREVELIGSLAEEKGFSPNIFTAVYEAVLNAHQHGNKLDESKRILIGTNITKKNLEVVVADEGEMLHPEFSAFILNLRNTPNIAAQTFSWYAFSGEEQPEINNGTGTSFMHTYMDEIRYFQSSELGGLAVYMSKTRRK